MTERRKKRRAAHGRGLLFAVLCATAAAVFKYSSFPAAEQLRLRVAEAWAGAPGMEKIVSAFGGAAEDTVTVFGHGGYAASSGGADDVRAREQTQFPDTADETVYSLGFRYVLPVKGTLTSAFGERLSPVTGEPAFHYGVDIAADEGTPIYAFADGTVQEIGASDYGNYLIIAHADGFSTLYAHCSSISAAEGEKIKRGDEIARVGQTGNATGPHLHLELWKDGAALDPADYLTEL